MSYGYNSQYQQQYRPYPAAPQVWQPPVQQNWQQPMDQTAATPEAFENPIVLALRDLTAEVSALRKSLNAMRKKEAEDE